MPDHPHSPRPTDSRTILGIPFFQGTAQQAVERACSGGLVIVPAAPALKDLATSRSYRASLLDADLVLADSAYMVLVWNLLEHDNITRLSGLGYLRELILDSGFRQTGNTLWVMPSARAITRNVAWLAAQGIEVPDSHVYLAPMYTADDEGDIHDPELLALIERLRPQHVVLTIGGGTQEPLGHSLKQQLSYRPAIHCVGAAIAFLSGMQVLIPAWADKLYLGWLFRTVSEPGRFGKRYWEARKLFRLIQTYRDRLPDLIQ